MARPSRLCWHKVPDLYVQVSELIYGRLQQLLAGAEDTWGIDMPWLPQRVQEVPGGVLIHGWLQHSDAWGAEVCMWERGGGTQHSGAACSLLGRRP